ncbi:MAG: RNA polymerase sporulation sigma factor SigH [Clostridia bacterium]|nr:RNA polymerase sporulation sigma factor SigH [Clostridia bacterium]
MIEKDFDYQLLADEQVVELSAEGDKQATEYILSKYKNLVRARAKDYYLAGADRDDLVQEGMIGLFKAIRDFDITKQASFRGFAELCIKRQILTAVKMATRQKHIPLNSYVSLSSAVYEEDSERTLVEMLAERESNDPEELLLRREKAEAMELEIAQKLSSLERSVLSLHLSGMDYREIAVELGREPKSIDNALQRIKRKLTTNEE